MGCSALKQFVVRTQNAECNCKKVEIVLLLKPKLAKNLKGREYRQEPGRVAVDGFRSGKGGEYGSQKVEQKISHKCLVTRETGRICALKNMRNRKQKCPQK